MLGLRSFLVLSGCTLVLSCTTARMTRTADVVEAREPDCQFDVFTMHTPAGFQEIAVVDIAAYYDAITTADAFRKRVAPEVCKAGGDAVAAMVNGNGVYVKGVILRRTADATSEAAQLDTPASDLNESRAGDGSLELRARLRFDGFSVFVNATPAKDSGKAFLGMRTREDLPDWQSCSLRLMVDGALLALDEPRYKHANDSQELRTSIAYDDLMAIARGSRVLGRVCEVEFRFEDEHLKVVRELVLRLREERGWETSAPDGGSPDAEKDAEKKEWI